MKTVTKFSGTGTAALAALVGTSLVAVAGISLAAPRMAQMPLAHGSVPIDPNMKAVLDQFKPLGARPVQTLTPQQARSQPGPPDAVKAVLIKRGMSTAPEPVMSVVDKTVPGPVGPVPVRIYRPEKASTKALPVLVYFHGGGFVIASITAYDSSCRALANAANCLVVAVGYRLAPEARLPAADEDSYAATQYVLKNVGAWGGDPKRVAVGGESAGGNLATDMCLMARDRKGLMPIYQLLVYPYVDVSFGSANSPSAIRYSDAVPLNRPMLTWFSKFALPNAAAGKNKEISPLFANLHGLPPATVVQAQLDPLQSQGTAYIAKLRAAGVPVRHQLYAGVTHEFFGMGVVVPEAKDAVAFAAAGLKAAFAK